MYEPETVLVLKEPRSTEEDQFPYDRVEVIGQSPIHHGTRAEEWEGAQGQGVIVKPLNGFGSTLDEPYGKLRDLYNVESTPVREAAAQATVKLITDADLGPSPEEQFADAAKRSTKKAPAAKRKPSPLGGDPEESDG